MQTITTMTREVIRLRAEVALRRPPADSPQLARLRLDPARILSEAGIRPDRWQAELLRSSVDRVLLLASRQVGKSTVAAALALREALLTPGSLVLLLSPSERQSGELAAKVFEFYDALGAPVPARKRTELQLHLTNRSRIIALPESERTVRGYSGAKLLVIDEAARVGDSLYYAVRPMLAVSRGKLIALTTAFAKVGFFHRAWESEDGWTRIRVPATECSRIPAAFLEEERRTLGPRWFGMEYDCCFSDAVDQVFDSQSVAAAVKPSLVAPLF